jgi:hypothetical protein
MGFVLTSFENRTRDLDLFAAEKIFEYGSLEAYYQSVVPEDSEHSDFFPCAAPEDSPAKSSCASAQSGLQAKPQRAPGYFLSVFRRL